MIKFLLKGIIRDRARSLMPVIVVTIGVFVVVIMDGFIGGMMGNMVNMTANFQTGHVKIMTCAYANDEEQKPNDLALLDVEEMMVLLKRDFPEIDWTPRIMFGGLLDIPDAHGETKAQGPVMGQSFDFLTPGSREIERVGLRKAIVSGDVIQQSGEVLVSVDFAEKFDVAPGDMVTFFGSTMYGSMSFANYRVAGIVRFGMSMLDRGAIILDLADARMLLDMEDAAGEIFGFFSNDLYDNKLAEDVKNSFNSQYSAADDEFSPVMLQLADQQMMSQILFHTQSITSVMVVLLIFALSIVLWNAGILGGIRRYNEFGVRLAMGEEKKHIYGTLLIESLGIGIIGSFVGTVLGIALCQYLSVYGIDYSQLMENISMMLDPVIRTKISPRTYYIGFIPGIASMLIGTALAGRAVYKRKTAMLFKELV
ncbi:MAG: ABC transporter permease [Bacteroidales bacterium]|nr:ABC transporter permease [Bacteroidales bacterium]